MAKTGLLELDPNLVACVLLHLQPADLAQVGQTCSELAREVDADVVWCTLFLRRFGADFWGETAPGPHPYTAVPEERNEWLEHGITDLFARFSLNCHHREEKPAAAGDGDEGAEEEEAEGEPVENRLMEFVHSHAKAGAGGYGGWKAAYRRMHDMVKEWRKPVDSAYIVAGLPEFSTLSAITDIIKQGALEGLPKGRLSTSPNYALKADVVSPGGQCRVIRMSFTSPDLWGSPVERVANICVIRKPRNWYHADKSLMFRGLKTFGSLRSDLNPKLVYVVDGERMERSEHYQERVYRELHGVLGEGKGHIQSGLAVALFLLNTTARSTIIDRLRVKRFTQPHHMCPYYAGPVYFAVANLANVRKGDDVDAADYVDQMSWPTASSG